MTTVIGRTAKFRGELTGTDDLLIDGEFEGSIRQTAGRLTIGPEANVRASIVSPEVVVSGKVFGDIRSIGRVDLRSTAVVVGNVFASRFSMEENASLSGIVDPSRAGESEPPSVAVTQPLFAVDETEEPEADVPEPMPYRAEGSLGVPRTPDLFNTQTGTPLHQGRQMPSALAALAAAARQETAQDTGTSGAESSDDYENSDTTR